jgi:hypothetical protein
MASGRGGGSAAAKQGILVAITVMNCTLDSSGNETTWIVGKTAL